jgi:hypothetical protein
MARRTSAMSPALFAISVGGFPRRRYLTWLNSNLPIVCNCMFDVPS